MPNPPQSNRSIAIPSVADLQAPMVEFLSDGSERTSQEIRRAVAAGRTHRPASSSLISTCTIPSPMNGSDTALNPSRS